FRAGSLVQWPSGVDPWVSGAVRLGSQPVGQAQSSAPRDNASACPRQEELAVLAEPGRGVVSGRR
ncbi:hypothetical protein ABT112_27260, partial [Streptomyces sp. NPDC002055]|uniref:hypothetical protein n=1 Tax=Streptomyces sp. NPDC002055 TaxID=3154534 RepID=UPI003320F0C9